MKTTRRTAPVAFTISVLPRDGHNRVAIALVLGLVCASVWVNLATTAVRAQDGMAIIRLKNDGDMELTAKLVEGAPRAVKLIGSSMYALRVPPGNYYFLYQFYDADHQSYIYQRTNPFAAGANLTTTIECCRRSHYFGGSPYESTASEFKVVPNWPEGVKTESNPHFDALKLIVSIQDLYLPSGYQRTDVVRTVMVALNPILARSVLLPLRREGFKVAYTGTNLGALPERYSEPTMVVTYKESEGGKLGIDHGISINCRLSLYGPGSTNSEPMWEEELFATNLSGVMVPFRDPYSAIRNNSLGWLKTQFDELSLDLSKWKTGK